MVINFRAFLHATKYAQNFHAFTYISFSIQNDLCTTFCRMQTMLMFLLSSVPTFNYPKVAEWKNLYLNHLRCVALRP